MIHQGFQYIVQARVVLSPDEIKHIMKAGLNHYDWYCRSVCEQGGFVYGINNQMSWREEEEFVTATLSFHQIDTIVKILELEYLINCSNVSLYEPMHKLLQSLNTKQVGMYNLAVREAHGDSHSANTQVEDEDVIPF